MLKFNEPQKISCCDPNCAEAVPSTSLENPVQRAYSFSSSGTTMGPEMCVQVCRKVCPGAPICAFKGLSDTWLECFRAGFCYG